MDAIFNKLAVTTPTDLEVVLTRSFDAPAHLVFDCLTKVEHVRKWWGCEETEATFDIDLRVGGKWRFVLFMADLGQQGFHGEYREIVPPSRLVYTFIYEPFPDNGAIVTILLTERGGRTTLTETILHQTKQDRDNCLATGFDKGASTSYTRLENLLLEMQEAN
ncbi:hypothetical protein IZ6_14250 [Terrihabitans soli]|uniref:Activator of Hsp90 ATPase homologue 1/2-like C-terminal domain-containing protein n=1 Tax=Terrihabitans soli TaxID=708113 RepID=A0A6S6QUR0_9HYPH|nr:SRPBCC family protein [Terrihabitans soli]BCJ90690.1 hypothetical protein IZ6_14250 [Terrihabitans soli]